MSVSAKKNCSKNPFVLLRNEHQWMKVGEKNPFIDHHQRAHMAE